VSRKTQRWSSREHETDAGAVESRQWIRLARELVEADEAGARELGRRYMGGRAVLARARAAARRS